VKAEGEHKYNSTLSLTSVPDVSEWLTPRPGRFTAENDPVQEAGWAPGPVWTVFKTIMNPELPH